MGEEGAEKEKRSVGRIPAHECTGAVPIWRAKPGIISQEICSRSHWSSAEKAEIGIGAWLEESP